MVALTLTFALACYAYTLFKGTLTDYETAPEQPQRREQSAEDGRRDTGKGGAERLHGQTCRRDSPSNRGQ